LSGRGQVENVIKIISVSVEHIICHELKCFPSLMMFCALLE
jgi:hypothetical protein